MADHAKLSPSSAHRWMRCPGSVAMESKLPDKDSEFSQEGTLAHALAGYCLEEQQNAGDMVAEPFTYMDHGTEKTANITADMARDVQIYIDEIRRAAEGHELMVEQRLPFFTGDTRVPEQFGTSDVVILAGRQLQVRDLKFGKGVQVYAEENEQLMLYALGALDQFGIVQEFDEVLMAIHQPRLGHVDEWVCSVEHLRAFEERAKAAAVRALSINELFGGTVLLEPGDKQCRFCKAKGGCPVLRDQVLSTVAGDFEVLEQTVIGEDDLVEVPIPVIDNLIALGKGEIAVSITDAEKILAAAHGVAPKAVDFAPTDHSSVPDHFVVKKPTIRPVLDGYEGRIAALDDQHLAACGESLDLVEGWAKAVRAELERRLLAGTHVPGYKLVTGKQGNRAWSNIEEAQAALKSYRLKVEEMYDLSLISPTTAEKLTTVQDEKGKPLIGPKQWTKLQALITRSEGKPSVAPASDKRPEWTPPDVSNDFDELTGGGDDADLADLL